MNEVLKTILQNTYSLTQLKYRLRLLKSSLLDSFFGAKGQDPAVSIQANTSIPPHDLTWLKSLPEDFYDKFTKDNVYGVFTNLEKEANSLPTLIMYLTFEPDEATLNQIGIFVRKASSLPALLLDIKMDPGLIAGTALVWHGVQRDYSLRAKINEKKSEISEGFKRFLR